MTIEVDMSGKIEQTWLDTVVAFSNKYQYAIKLPRDAKREILNKLKQKGQKQIILKVFCVCLYYLLKDYAREDRVFIDKEYTGKDNIIKSILFGFMRKDNSGFDSKRLKFVEIKKTSNAHKVAVTVQRGKERPQKILTEEEIYNILKIR